MNLKSYFDSERGAAKKLAEALGVSPSYLSQMSAGTTPISPERAVLIEESTAGAVTRRDLFPDNWERIWPELRNSQPAAA